MTWPTGWGLVRVGCLALFMVYQIWMYFNLRRLRALVEAEEKRLGR